MFTELSPATLSFLNVTLFIVHTALIVFNLTGWIWQRTRRLHWLTVGATLFSWVVMGVWRGWGYCLCADWHFQIRRAMGIRDDISSYTQLLIREACGVTLGRLASDVITVGGLAVVLLAMTVVRWRELRGKNFGR